MDETGSCSIEFLLYAIIFKIIIGENQFRFGPLTSVMNLSFLLEILLQSLAYALQYPNTNLC